MSPIHANSARYSPSSGSERRAIKTFASILNHSLVKDALEVDDKIPNIDGYLTLTNAQGYILGKLEAQVKSLPQRLAKIRPAALNQNKIPPVFFPGPGAGATAEMGITRESVNIVDHVNFTRMAMCGLTCADAKKIDLVDYLAGLGYHPQNVSHPDYWYLSPLRDEKTASFKVNRKLNVFYDHGIGKGGDLIDFGTCFYNCSVSDFLHRLAGQLKQNSISFHPPTQESKTGLWPADRDTFSAGEKKENRDSKILIIGDRPISANPLLNYLEKRKIPLEIAERYCREIDNVHKVK